MYAVFEKTLMTDKGKSLVRTYQSTFDAQKIYQDLQAYALLSTKATLDASDLLSYIASTTIDKWKGTVQKFILHWQDQVRKYHDLTPSKPLTEEVQQTLLQNAVFHIPELHAVKVQADQHKT